MNLIYKYITLFHVNFQINFKTYLYVERKISRIQIKSIAKSIVQHSKENNCFPFTEVENISKFPKILIRKLKSENEWIVNNKWIVQYFSTIISWISEGISIKYSLFHSKNVYVRNFICIFSIILPWFKYLGFGAINFVHIKLKTNYMLQLI